MGAGKDGREGESPVWWVVIMGKPGAKPQLTIPCNTVYGESKLGGDEIVEYAKVHPPFLLSSCFSY